MRFFTFSLILSAGAAFAAISQPAQAQSLYASTGYFTDRVCSQPEGENCVFSGLAPFRQSVGGLYTDFSTSFDNIMGLGASAAAQVAFGSGYLPITRVASYSGTQTRTGSNVSAIRSFTYEGTESINFALNGLLDYTNSGHTVQGDAAGEGLLNVILSLLPMSALSDFNDETTALDIISGPVPFMDCSNGAIASSYYSSLGTSAGYHVATLGLSQTCSGAAITLNPGDQFVIVATMQGISNRDGFINAMNTFKVVYDLENTVFTATGEQVGESYLLANVNGAVPEPATWAMMIGGFALAGGMMRRRNQPVAFA